MSEVTWPAMGDVNWAAVVVAGAASYALGSLSPAAAAARLRGVDLRGSGSGNPGATNAARAMGVQVGVLVGALDVAKGFAPVMFFNQYGEPCGEVAGIAAVLGHVTSPLLKGKGGKGVATSLGAILAIEPLWAVPVLVSFGATVGLTRQVGIGSVVGSVALLPTSFVDLARAGPGSVSRRGCPGWSCTATAGTSGRSWPRCATPGRRRRRPLPPDRVAGAAASGSRLSTDLSATGSGSASSRPSVAAVSRTQDLVLARLRLIAMRWQGGLVASSEAPGR